MSGSDVEEKVSCDLEPCPLRSWSRANASFPYAPYSLFCPPPCFIQEWNLNIRLQRLVHALLPIMVPHFLQCAGVVVLKVPCLI